MRIVFLGTPDFAVPTLDAVAREHEVALVVAQPDKPAGRGMKMHAPAVAVRARELGLPVLQPPKIRNEEFLGGDRARSRPTSASSSRTARSFRPRCWTIPKHGFLNVHASVLPQWRGAAPIQRSIEAGDRVTGVTIMRVDEELDHGPMLRDRDDGDRSRRTHARARARGSRRSAREALLPVLRDSSSGTAVETPQDHERATLAPKIEKSEGEIALRRNRADDLRPLPRVRSVAGHLRAERRRDDQAHGHRVRPMAAASRARSCRSRTTSSSPRATARIRILEMQRPGKPRTPARRRRARPRLACRGTRVP